MRQDMGKSRLKEPRMTDDAQGPVSPEVIQAFDHALLRAHGPLPPPTSCPISWQPAALTPVFYGARDLGPEDGAPVRLSDLLSEPGRRGVLRPDSRRLRPLPAAGACAWSLPGRPGELPEVVPIACAVGARRLRRGRARIGGDCGRGAPVGTRPSGSGHPVRGDPVDAAAVGRSRRRDEPARHRDHRAFLRRVGGRAVRGQRWNRRLTLGSAGCGRTGPARTLRSST